MDVQVDDGGVLITADDPAGAPAGGGRRKRGRGKPTVVTKEEQRERYETRQSTFWILIVTLLHQKRIADGVGVKRPTPEQQTGFELDKLLETLAEEERVALARFRDGQQC